MSHVEAHESIITQLLQHETEPNGYLQLFVGNATVELPAVIVTF
jgi:hypothetical protein